MVCCQCQGIEDIFNQQLARSQLANYRKKGPDKTTRMLVDFLKSQGVEDATLLDIGGGVGAIQHELLNAGAQTAEDIDASYAYIQAAREEAQRRGMLDKISFEHGNFVDLAPEVSPADIVTLDRVICCYPDMIKMVQLSTTKARKLYGIVYPRDSWWVKIGMWALNKIMSLRRNPFRTFVHPSRQVEGLINQEGFQRIAYAKTRIWQVAVYKRYENRYNWEYSL